MKKILKRENEQKKQLIQITYQRLKVRTFGLLSDLEPTHFINALSFYRFQNVLGWSNFFVPDQTFIYILRQLQTFCARQKDDLHSVKLVYVPAQKFLKRH